MIRSLRAAALVVGALALITPVPLTARAAEEEAVHSPNLEPVANLAYAERYGTGANQGTDIEFARLSHKGTVRDFAVAGSYDNGMQLIDISKPSRPVIVGVYDCGISQGDVQVFRRGSRTYATFTMDSGYTLQEDSRCVRDAKRMGMLATTAPSPLDIDPFGDFGRPGIGTYIADITDPTRPTTVSHVPVTKGSHNQTVHPSGRYLYNSNSSLVTTALHAGIEVFDISDFRKPKLVTTLPLPPIPGLGAESHDITFNTDGTRAYSAALSHTAVIDTTDPRAPRILSVIVDPLINVHHQSTAVTLTDELTGLERDFLLIEDELAGAAGFDPCPSGGLHVYDVTGPLELAPIKVGYWNIADLRYPALDGGPIGSPCTMHVFQVHPEAGILVAAFYNGGVRVVDIDGLIGVALGESGVGMKEIAYARFADSMTWSAKTPRISPDGSFHLYGNDMNRGFDVYRFDASRPAAAASPGSWLTGTAAPAGAGSQQAATAARPFCLIGDERRALPGVAGAVAALVGG